MKGCPKKTRLTGRRVGLCDLEIKHRKVIGYQLDASHTGEKHDPRSALLQSSIPGVLFLFLLELSLHFTALRSKNISETLFFFFSLFFPWYFYLEWFGREESHAPQLQLKKC